MVTLLLVEDSNFQRKVIMSMLDKFDIRIIDCETPRIALKNFKNEEIDIVLTDLNLPEMSGVEFIKEVRSGDKDIPIIGMTSPGSFDDDQGTAIDAGAAFVLCKPFKGLDELSELIDHIKINKAVS